MMSLSTILSVFYAAVPCVVTKSASSWWTSVALRDIERLRALKIRRLGPRARLGQLLIISCIAGHNATNSTKNHFLFVLSVALFKKYIVRGGSLLSHCARKVWKSRHSVTAPIPPSMHLSDQTSYY